MTSLDPKVLISLVSVALGWLLSQSSTVFRDWWQARKLKTGLFEELCDLDDQLRRVVLIHARQIQFYALKGIEANASLPLQNMFFRQYYKESFSHLNRSQRLSYQLIHSLVENLNEQEKELAQLGFELERTHRPTVDQSVLKDDVERFGIKVIEVYKAARDCQWHIAYHRMNPEVPRMDLDGPMHQSYLEFLEVLETEVADAIKTSSQLRREDLEAIAPKK